MAKTDQDRKTSEEYLTAPYGRALFRNDDGTYTAEMLEFAGCFAEGDTAEEAVRNLDQSAREWIEASLNLGREIPEPFATRGYSGTISLRLPKAIHRQAARMAERDGVSLNQYLLTAISARVGADDLFNRMEQRLMTTMTTTAMTINVGVISMSTTNAAIFMRSNTVQDATAFPITTGATFGSGVSQSTWHFTGGGAATLQGLGIGTTGSVTSTNVISGSVGTGSR